MKPCIVALLVIMAATSISANGQSKQNAQLEEAKKAIAQSNALYHQSTAKNDSSIFLNSYTEDACVLPPNAPMVCGREALAKFFRAGYNMGIRGGKFITTNVYGNGIEYVTEEGTGQVFDEQGNVFDDFKYLVIWKKTKDGWKMYRDSFNSNRSKD
jgi:ketosteroid isomerase-like protein